MLAGTRLLKGTAKVRILFTGAETLYGEIVRFGPTGHASRTPLQSAVDNLVAILLSVAAVICLGLAWVRWEQGHGLLDALLSAVTLAVAALPRRISGCADFFLGVGVYRLAKRQALVRRAVVVENIGRVSCICCRQNRHADRRPTAAFASFSSQKYQRNPIAGNSRYGIALRNWRSGGSGHSQRTASPTRCNTDRKLSHLPKIANAKPVSCA